MRVFDVHLTATDEIEPEHFEALDGWSFRVVRDWQASSATGVM
jgi:hypothetical protein